MTAAPFPVVEQAAQPDPNEMHDQCTRLFVKALAVEPPNGQARRDAEDEWFEATLLNFDLTVILIMSIYDDLEAVRQMPKEMMIQSLFGILLGILHGVRDGDRLGVSEAFALGYFAVFTDDQYAMFTNALHRAIERASTEA